MLQCALTGGIGSGKSTLADGLQAQGFPVLRADRLAAEAIAPDTPGLAAVIEHFGPQILGEDGRLDRKALGNIIFQDPEQKAALERIVHPIVQALYAQACQALRSKGKPLVFYEIPLLLETQRVQSFDAVVVITAPLPARITRIMQRNGLDQAQVQARLANQASDFQRTCIADFVVHNDGSLDALHRQAAGLLPMLEKRLAFKQSLERGT